MIDNITLLGLIAAFLGMLAFLPQAIRIWHLKETRDISLSTCVILVVSAFLWIAYGFLRGDLPILVANSISLIFSGITLFFKIKFG